MSAEGTGSLRADVVVVAAGSSRRMAGTDKLMAEIGGRPLLAWTLEACAAAPCVERLVLVAAPERVDEWRSGPVASRLRDRGRRGRRHAAGSPPPPGCAGSTPRIRRDGTGPSSSTTGRARSSRPALVAAVAEAARRHGAALPVLPVAETLKRVGDGLVLETVDRSTLAAAQTPQGARRGLLLDAWAAYPPEGPPGVHRRGRPARGL